MKIYHNPRCSKSRETLEIIQKAGKEVEIIDYQNQVPTEKKLTAIIKLLGINAEDL
jgi:arsenate reductase